MTQGEGRSDQEAIEELVAELEEYRVNVVLVHRLRVHLAAAAISAHVECGHSGPWLSLPDGERCQDEECLEFSAVTIEADKWLADKRDWLDVPPLEPLVNTP